MRIKAFTSFFALLVLTLAAPSSASAEAAAGTYQFSFDDGYVKYVQFDAVKENGRTTGQVYLTDEATLVIRDLDGAGEPEEGKYPGFYFKANFDDMVVNKNQAVMTGVIFDASLRSLIGQRVLLTVEDNGDNTRDKLTWGVYKPIQRNWTPSDAELKEDPGVGLRWWATDAERRDDVGYQMPRDESISVSSFPISSYAFIDTSDGVGDIRVQP